jgi:hypothetical protein
MTLSRIESAIFRLLSERLGLPTYSVALTGIHIRFAPNTSEENVKGKLIPPSIYHTSIIYVLPR